MFGSTDGSRSLRDWLLPVVLAAVVASLYAWASRGHDFIYDDDIYIVGAQPIESVSDALNLFVEKHPGNLPYYRPLTRGSYILQKTIHGNVPGPIHVGNAVLAGLVLLAAFGLLRRPVFAIAYVPAVLASVIFAVHPLASACVYPGASGRETMLPSVLILVSLWAYLSPGALAYGVSVVAFLLALLGKELALTLVPLLVLADMLGMTHAPRQWGRRLLRYLPFVLIVAGYLFTRYMLYRGYEMGLRWTEHPTLIAWTYLFAIQSTFAPWLELRYEPPISTWFSWPHMIVSVLATGVVVVCFLRARRVVGRAGVFWLAWFFVTQLLTANLFWQEMPFSERYAFLSMLAIPASLAMLVSQHWSSERVRRVTTLAGVVMAVVLMSISVYQARFYADRLAFFTHWAKTSPRHYRAVYNAGLQHQRANLLPQAIEYYRRTLELQPDDVDAYNNLGVALQASGRFPEARDAFEQAVRYRPNELMPRLNLGRLLHRMGQPQSAMIHYEHALRVDPDHVELQIAYAGALRDTGQIERAMQIYQQVLEREPDHSAALHGVGVLLANRGQIDQAIATFQRVVQVDPANPDARYNLALLLRQRGDTRQAIEQYQLALRAAPDMPRVLNDLAWLLATSADDQLRDPKQAVQLAQRAAELTQSRSGIVLDCLAAAHAAAGEFEQAVAIAQQAVMLAQAQRDPDLPAMQQRLQMYRRGEAYREPTAASRP